MQSAVTVTYSVVVLVLVFVTVFVLPLPYSFILTSLSINQLKAPYLVNEQCLDLGNQHKLLIGALVLPATQSTCP